MQHTEVRDAQRRAQRRRSRRRASLGDQRACSARAARPQHRRQPTIAFASFLLWKLHAMYIRMSLFWGGWGVRVPMKLGRASGDDFYDFKPDKFVGGGSSLRT